VKLITLIDDRDNWDVVVNQRIMTSILLETIVDGKVQIDLDAYGEYYGIAYIVSLYRRRNGSLVPEEPKQIQFMVKPFNKHFHTLAYAIDVSRYAVYNQDFDLEGSPCIRITTLAAETFYKGHPKEPTISDYLVPTSPQTPE